MIKPEPTMTEEYRVANQPNGLDVIQQPEHQSSRSKFANWIAIGALGVILLALIPILMWSFDNRPVLEIKNSPFPTRTIREHPTADGVVFLDAEFCKNKNIDGELRISFIGNTQEVFLPLAVESGPLGCKRQEVPIAIPHEIDPGEYKVKFRVTYDKNPLKQNEVVEFESRSFIIDPSNP